MESVDITVLIVTIVLTVLLIFGNLYFIAHYSHHADSKFGNNILTKGVLVSPFQRSHVYKGSRIFLGRGSDPADSSGRLKRASELQSQHGPTLVYRPNEQLRVHVSRPPGRSFLL